MEPEIGDDVTIHAALCEVDGMGGKIIAIDLAESMPYMVRLYNFREWPFARHELEVHRLDED